MAQHTNVLIVGAGISGLAAAELLQQKGVNYKILEATDRIGGRIKTLKQNQGGQQYFLELGAGWIHSKSRNPVYKLAKENGLLKPHGKKHTDPRLTVGNIQYWEEGKVIGKAHWREVKGLYNKAIDEVEKLFIKETCDESDVDLRTFIEEHVKKQLDPSDKDKYETKLKILETLIRSDAGLIGSQDLSEVSANQAGSYRPADDAWVLLPRGYESVIDVIKSKIPDENVMLNHPVSQISLSLDCTTGGATVTCENGQVFSADHVIFTASLGYLKEHGSHLFSPPLPVDKLSAIQKLGFGTANRIYMEFENLDFLKEKTLGEIFLVKAKESTSDAWEDNLYSFYCQEVPKCNVLTTWLMGEHAKTIEKLSDEEIIRKLQEILQKFLKVPVPMPSRIIRTAWSSEPYVKGSWTFMKLGSCIQDIKKLAEPILHKTNNQPILLFAGEATHEHYYSSTPGAYLSGQREAKRLLNYYSK